MADEPCYWAAKLSCLNITHPKAGYSDEEGRLHFNTIVWESIRGHIIGRLKIGIFV